MLRTTLVLLFAGIPMLLHAQSWETLFGSPVTSRHNDVYFVSPDTGWAVSGAATIHRTNDGGRTWEQQFLQSQSHLRSVGFLNAQRGFAGNVGLGEFGTTDPTVLYETSDGGETWSPVIGFHGRTPAGLCGMQVVNDSTIVAVGRVRGPAFFARTTDGGRTWHSKDMSAYAAGLIDVYFTHPDSGIAVGLTNEEHDLSSGIVLATTDGGETWEERFVTSRTGEWCWKISAPTPKTAYVSLQRNSRSPIYFLKTVDGGSTWEEKLFSTSYYFVQGIGFVNENVGWIGGNSTEPAYQTTDGGESWDPVDIGIRLNRFRFIGDSLGYAAGSRIHKFTAQPSTGIDAPDLPSPVVGAAYPNPFDREIVIPYDLDSRQHVAITVYDMLGRSVRSIGEWQLPAGSHHAEWDGRDDVGRPAPAGLYVIVFRIGPRTVARPVAKFR